MTEEYYANNLKNVLRQQQAMRRTLGLEGKFQLKLTNCSRI